MAQIDTSGIENFDAMTADEKVAALLAFQYDDGTAKVKEAEDRAAKLKAAMDKAASEAAGYKKQLSEKMTDEERKKQEADSAYKEMQARLEENEKKIAEYEQRERLSNARTMFLGGGFEDALSSEAAAAFIEGDAEKFGGILKKYREAIEAKAKAELMGNNPKPESGGKPGEKDDGKDSSVAAQLGKVRAEQEKKARGILDQYTRREN